MVFSGRLTAHIQKMTLADIVQIVPYSRKLIFQQLRETFDSPQDEILDKYLIRTM